ncbi:MAG: gliding motility-associated C-terminal domain-containing protein [Flavitalea sp.]
MLIRSTFVLILILTVSCCFANPSLIDTCIGEPFHKVITPEESDRRISINDLIEDEEGNIYLVGRKERNADNTDALFMKTDRSGNILWQHSFDLSNEDECWKIRRLRNGNFLIAGFKTYDLLVFEIDRAGNILFSKSYSGRQAILSDMLIDEDDNILLCGLMYDQSNLQQSFLTKLNNNGELIYTRLYDSPGNEQFITITSFQDSYYIAAQARAATNNGVLVRLNKLTGDINWSYQYDIGGRIDVITTIHSSASGIYFNGATRNPNPPARFNQFNGKLDVNGNVSEVYSYGNFINQFGSNFIPLSDGSFMMTQSLNNGDPFVTLLKYDQNRQLTWGKKIAVDQNFPNPLVLPSSNGFLLSHIQKLSANGIHVARTDENGSIPGCPDFPATETLTAITLNSSPFNYTTSSIDLVTTNELIRLESTLQMVMNFCSTGCSFINITGPQELCFSNETFTYLIDKEVNCTEEVIWTVDPSVASILKSDNKSIDLRFLSPGTVKLQASIGSGCSIISEIHEINIRSGSLPVSLGRDTLFCDGSGYTLTIPGYRSYTWSDASKDSSLAITRSGTYFITVEDYCGTISSDTVVVAIAEVPLVKPRLPRDTALCSGDSLFIMAGEGYASYLWNTGSTDVYIIATMPGEYSVLVSNPEGCTAADTIRILPGTCSEFLVFPNAFTPNNDGKNDRFKPFTNQEITAYHLVIFNRWGQKVYESKKINEGWDGQPVVSKDKSSTYVYFCRYQVAKEKERVVRGTITLVR